MGRTEFISHFEQICKDNSIVEIADLKRGAEELSFTYTGEGLGGCTWSILLPDLGSYPREYPVYICCDSDKVPELVNRELSEITSFDGPLQALLKRIVRSIASKLKASGDVDTKDASSGTMDEDECRESTDVWNSDEEDVEEVDYDDYDDDSENENDDDKYDDDYELFQQPRCYSTNLHGATDSGTRISLETVRKYLIAAKSAGFRIGICGDPRSSLFSVSLSVRIQKLGLSEEAVSAWELNPSHYLVLLIRFENSYKDSETLSCSKNPGVSFHTGICTKYKPSAFEVARAFSKSTPVGNKNEEKELFNFFLTKSLGEIFKSFPQLLGYRLNKGLNWDGAEKLYFELLEHSLNFASDYTTGRRGTVFTSKNFPQIVRSDAMGGLNTADERKRISMPLLAMQFCVRRMVHCTKFCLVCHRRVNSEFTALLPYVCSNELCLFQHICMAIDDTVERTILTRTDVMDLLGSFCYSSCISGSLKDLPKGLNIKGVNPQGIQGEYAWKLNRLIITDESKGLINRVKVGDLVCFMGQFIEDDHPFSVEVLFTIRDTLHFPIIDLSEPLSICSEVVTTIRTGRSASNTIYQFANPIRLQDFNTPQSISGTVHLTDTPLENLSDEQARFSIARLMRTIPPVSEMKKRVDVGGSLQKWPGKMMPDAYKILRWIIASNRSHIVPVDEKELVKPERPENATTAIEKYKQFRWAMGSPEKEEMLAKSVKAECSEIAPFPTIFAFHGSGLGNWHSILREGLHFNIISNGRAHGNGVYHALQMETSAGYSNTGLPIFTHACPVRLLQPPTMNLLCWPASELQITEALSLNEIVNAPNKFQAKSPYLVVQHLNWIQTRYLFVRNTVSNMNSSSKVTATPSPSGTSSKFSSLFSKPPKSKIELLPQDPAFTPTARGRKLSIPLPSYFKRNKLSADPFSLGKAKENSFLVSDDSDDGVEETFAKVNHPKTPRSLLGSMLDVTNFTPGITDYSRITFLPTPENSSLTATKALQKELSKLLSIQSNTPLQQLGWYIDENCINNLYQWVLELHSFPKSIPLAQDLEMAGIQSIIMEMRFTKSYPFSPPFARIVTPRFLPFMNGGGGHITAGGAICHEFLTSSGWTPVATLESVLLQIKVAIESLDPRPARLENVHSTHSIYSAEEARDAYIRACRAHGWVVTTEFLQSI